MQFVYRVAFALHITLIVKYEIRRISRRTKQQCAICGKVAVTFRRWALYLFINEKCWAYAQCATNIFRRYDNLEFIVAVVLWWDDNKPMCAHRRRNLERFDKYYENGFFKIRCRQQLPKSLLELRWAIYLCNRKRIRAKQSNELPLVLFSCIKQKIGRKRKSFSRGFRLFERYEFSIQSEPIWIFVSMFM